MPRIISFDESKVKFAKQSNFTKDRFVAFLDIMGFKDRVVRNAH